MSTKTQSHSCKTESMAMLDKVKSLGRRGKVHFYRGSSSLGPDSKGSTSGWEKRGSSKWSMEDPSGPGSKSRLDKRGSSKWSMEDPRDSWSPASSGSRVRFDMSSSSHAGSSDRGRCSRVTPTSTRDIYRRSWGDEGTIDKQKRRHSKSVMHLSAMVKEHPWGRVGSGSDTPSMVRRARSTGWLEGTAAAEKKETRRGRDGRILVYRKDSKSDSERVEEMFKLVSDCSGSSGTTSIQSVWQSLIAIENDVV